MGLRKSRVKKGSPRVYNSGLFGIIDKAEPANQMRNSEARLPVALNYKVRKSNTNRWTRSRIQKGSSHRTNTPNALQVEGFPKQLIEVPVITCWR